MTVKELIQKLKSLPPETIVLAWSNGNESHEYEVTDVDKEKVKTKGVITLSDWPA